MSRQVKLLSILAGAALFASILLIVLAEIRHARYGMQTSPDIADAPIPDAHQPIAAGKTAAPFKLTDLQGDPVSMADLRGKVVFLNIWATWCAPCREEMPSMEKLYERMRGNKGFVMLAVSQDTSGRDEVLNYVKKHGYHFDVLLDPKNAVAEAYNVSGVPETFIIDRQGRIVAHHSGAFDWSQPAIADALEELLKDSKAENVAG
jgi:peroxiredoxin